jgi:DAK2 domain fusion protein YloV
VGGATRSAPTSLPCMLQTIDARGARQWAVAALGALGEAREEIDELNVFPVPDGDTGTNLYLTVQAAVDAIKALPRRAGVREVIEAFAHGALMGARGNSGIIAAQLLRGWADVLAEREVLDGRAAKEAVLRADQQAWLAVDEPVEGTILSVSRAAATAAQSAGDPLPEVVTALVEAARAALERTTDQLEVLRRAGVVDAGGRGYLVLLETLDDLVHRRSRQWRRDGGPPGGGAAAAADGSVECRTDLSAHLRQGGPAYEVMYLLEADQGAVTTLRPRLAALGDSLAVVGGGGLWHVHVHVNDPGAAVEAGVEAGRPHRIRVTHFAEQASARAVAAAGPDPSVGLVACAAGPGLARLFEQAGARVVAGTRPSTGQLLEAIRATRAQAVVVLPNDGDTLAAAEQAARIARGERLRVTVLPTRAQVQGLAAAAVHDPARSVDTDVVMMSGAAGATRDGAVTVAVRDAITSAGVCRRGDVLGIVQGDIALLAPTLVEGGQAVLDRLLSGGGELLTLVAGCGPGDLDLVEALREHARRHHRGVEVSVLDGGQSRYPVLIGVE